MQFAHQGPMIVQWKFFDGVCGLAYFRTDTNKNCQAHLVGFAHISIAL